MQEYPTGDHSVGLWQCSCSSSHKRPYTSPPGGLMPFYMPVSSGYISDHILDTVLGDMTHFLGEDPEGTRHLKGLLILPTVTAIPNLNEAEITL